MSDMEFSAKIMCSDYGKKARKRKNYDGFRRKRVMNCRSYGLGNIKMKTQNQLRS